MRRPLLPKPTNGLAERIEAKAPAERTDYERAFLEGYYLGLELPGHVLSVLTGFNAGAWEAWEAQDAD